MGTATAELDIRRESLIAAAANVVLIAVQLATLGLLTRTLGADGVGTYFFALSAAILAIIPSRELGEIMRKRVSEIDSPSHEFFGLAQAGTVLYLLVCVPVLSLATPVVTAWTPLTGETVLAFGVYAAVLTQSEMATRLLDAVGKPGASMVSQTVRETVFFGGVLALVWLGGASPQTVLLLGAGVRLSVALGTYWVVGLVPRLPSRDSLASAVAFGKWSVPTGIASHVWGQAPTLLLGVVLGGSSVAVYETAKRVTMIGAYLATCITDPLLVKVSAMHSAGEDVLSHVELALDYTPSVALLTLFLVAPIAPEIMSLAAGSAYATGGVVLVGVALTRVLWGLKRPVSAALLGVGQPRYVFGLFAGLLTVGGPAIVLGATYGGVAGVVFVLVVLELGGVLLVQGVARLVFGRFVRPTTLSRQLVIAATAGAFVWLASHSLDLTSPSTLAAVLAGAVVLHYGLFALASDRFRAGSARTVRELGQALATVTPG
ncbi:oligosaccharide flippase family protein [Halorientalis brevis]|uniref:Oligosaccharide flippase family protein n=1 Tax=Halorientalis brevis TaxID=1126241 RepID=A0ABD6CGE9_9EURY|nr:lipopolysaccharide biosynthesis protein [Halorientalis brevis]